MACKHLREVTAIVEEFTTDHIIQFTGGGHLSIQIFYNGNKRTVYAPKTPSDRRSILNVKRKIKQAFHDVCSAHAISGTLIS
jgi:hypothetical protein